jgi:hypothetical protein
MKKSYLLTIVLILASIGIAFAENPNWPTNNGYPVQCNFGYKEVATPSITVGDVVKIYPTDYLPAGTIGFEIRAASGSFIINHADNLATGTSRVGRLVSQGETFQWNGLAGTFNGAILAVATNSLVVIDGAWGFFEP